jgi:hypothetical protein
VVGPVPRGLITGVGSSGSEGNISSICGKVGNGTDLALHHNQQNFLMQTGCDSLDDTDPEIRRQAPQPLGASSIPLRTRPMRDWFPNVEEREVRVFFEALEWIFWC